MNDQQRLVCKADITWYNDLIPSPPSSNGLQTLLHDTQRLRCWSLEFQRKPAMLRSRLWNNFLGALMTERERVNRKSSENALDQSDFPTNREQPAFPSRQFLTKILRQNIEIFRFSFPLKQRHAQVLNWEGSKLETRSASNRIRL